MIWHILTVVCGALAAVAAIWPYWISNIALGGLVVVFGFLALRSFRGGKKPKKETST